MEPKHPVELLRNQMLRLIQIATEEKLTCDEAGKPSDALDFAEFLLLCSSEDSARQRMRQDQKGAIAFFQIEAHLSDWLGEHGIPNAVKNLQDMAVCPFAVAGAYMQEYLWHLRKSAGDDWR